MLQESSNGNFYWGLLYMLWYNWSNNLTRIEHQNSTQIWFFQTGGESEYEWSWGPIHVLLHRILTQSGCGDKHILKCFNCFIDYTVLSNIPFPAFLQLLNHDFGTCSYGFLSRFYVKLSLKWGSYTDVGMVLGIQCSPCYLPADNEA